MSGSLAPVLSRIAEIETRISGAPPVSALDTTSTESSPAAGFDAAYDAALAEYPTATAGTWTGVGSQGWVIPGEQGATAAGYLAPVTGAGAAIGAYGSYGAYGAVGPVAGGSVPPDTPFAAHFEAAAARHGVPARLLAAVGWVESRYRPDAVSGAGAQGVMQLMPFVSEAYGVNPWDPAQAIDAAAQLLSEHHARFGSWDLALAAYNAGAGAVARAGNQPPSANVANYVNKVNERIEQM